MEPKANHAAATVYLDKLAEELTHRGFDAWLMAPPGRVPSVYVTNPAARALEENVYADQGKDGIWWFWWSWAERISIVDDLDKTATAVARVLTVLFAGGCVACGGTTPLHPPAWRGLRPPSLSPPPRGVPPKARPPPCCGWVKALWLLSGGHPKTGCPPAVAGVRALWLLSAGAASNGCHRPRI